MAGRADQGGMAEMTSVTTSTTTERDDEHSECNSRGAEDGAKSMVGRADQGGMVGMMSATSGAWGGAAGVLPM